MRTGWRLPLYEQPQQCPKLPEHRGDNRGQSLSHSKTNSTGSSYNRLLRASNPLSRSPQENLRMKPTIDQHPAQHTKTTKDGNRNSQSNTRELRWADAWSGYWAPCRPCPACVAARECQFSRKHWCRQGHQRANRHGDVLMLSQWHQENVELA